MSVRRLAAAEIQPESFAFTAENAVWAGQQMAKYPDGRQASAVIPLLWKAQQQAGGWVPQKAIEHVAEVLGMPYIRVLEIATFYTMFNLEPVGRFFVQLCGTTPCQLRGSDGIKKVCAERIGPQRHVTADGNFSWLEVECLGACCNAPMVQINDDYYEDLTPETFNKLLDDLAAGRPVKPGPQNGRRSSEPEGAVKTLQDATLFDGSVVGAWRKRFEDEEAKAAAGAAGGSSAAGASDPTPAKPATTSPTEKSKADTPAHRAAAGKEPASTTDASKSHPATAPEQGERSADKTDKPKG
jgi:NADH-quinone oxidoreductase subunit E